MVWAFEQSPSSAAYLWDTRLRLRRANRYAERALDLTEAEMRGLRPPEVMPGPEIGRVERALLQTLETGEPQYMETYTRDIGESREHAWSNFLYPLRDEDGAVRGVGQVTRDITEQHWARKRLQLLNDAGARIGSTLDVARTAQELAAVAVPEFADFATVDLLPDPDAASETAPRRQAPGRRRPARSGCAAPRSSPCSRAIPEAVVPVGEVAATPPAPRRPSAWPPAGPR